MTNVPLLLFLSDEDMQSLASLMSVKPTDIGNLDDFNESDEDEDRKSVTATGGPPDLRKLFLSLSLILTVNDFLSRSSFLYLPLHSTMPVTSTLSGGCCSCPAHSRSPKPPSSPSAHPAKLHRSLFTSLR